MPVLVAPRFTNIHMCCAATWSMLPDQRWDPKPDDSEHLPRRAIRWAATDPSTVDPHGGRTAKTRMQQQRTQLTVANATHKWDISRKSLRRIRHRV